VAKEAAEGRRREEKDTMEESFIFSRTWRGVAWRGVAWRGVAWRGVAREFLS
jgi:hypothetical protein